MLKQIIESVCKKWCLAHICSGCRCEGNSRQSVTENSDARRPGARLMSPIRSWFLPGMPGECTQLAGRRENLQGFVDLRTWVEVSTENWACGGTCGSQEPIDFHITVRQLHEVQCRGIQPCITRAETVQVSIFNKLYARWFHWLAHLQPERNQWNHLLCFE